ncbi:hypothetical protein R1sor_011171 [Riccia sorocarpa]|uniref:Uncharacterized protein n=1 Tax=Riccia sorocarpa TaxID=122646 RepID=A0ABD3I035_9MARC
MGNQLLAKFREEISSQVPVSQSITPSGTTVGGSRTKTPIFGRSAPETTTHAPPTRRIRLDWDLDLLSLPQEQNNDVNAKVRDKFSAWGRNKRQYLNKNIRSVSSGTKIGEELLKICNEELQSELQKLNQQESMEKLREAQRKKEERNHVYKHHFGAGGRRLFKEEFVSIAA